MRALSHHNFSPGDFQQTFICRLQSPPEPFRYFQTARYLDACHSVPHLLHRLAGDFDSHRQLAFAAIDRGHPLHDGVGHNHARHFIPHERSVAVTYKRPDAGDDGNIVTLHLVEKAQQGVGIEHRLRDGELRARNPPCF